MPESYLKGKHIGFHSHRMKNNLKEREFAVAWTDLCDRGHLEWQLGNGTEPCQDLTERDAHIAATVIQWLGSPVGLGFLRDLGYVRAE